MRSKLRLIALVVGILFALGLAARPISADNSPKGSYTLDQAGVLSEKTKDYITERNYNLEDNCGGAQIFVAVLSSIGSMKIESRAEELFKENNLGDNGVLLLMAIGERDYHILPGSGLSSALTTRELSNIIRNYLEPFFNDGDYDSAAKESFKKLNEVVCRAYNADPNGYGKANGSGSSGSGRINAGGISSCSSRGRAISCNSCGGLLFLGCVACVGYEIFG